MLLEEYFRKHNLNTVSFGVIANVCHTTLWNFINGKTDMKLYTAAKIVKATGNEVTFNDLLEQRRKSLTAGTTKANQRVKTYLIDLNKLQE